MLKSRAVLVTASATIIVLILVGLFMFQWPSEEQSPSELAPETEAPINLGITYLPITPGLAAYYGLGVDCGALVTEVTPGSSADKAGVEVGDVILSFNGVKLEETVPLLGLMRLCHAGSRVTMEIQRESSTRMVELFHNER